MPSTWPYRRSLPHLPLLFGKRTGGPVSCGTTTREDSMGPASRVSAAATGSLRPSLTPSSTLSPTATTFVPNSVLDHRLNHLSVNLHHLHHLVYFLLHTLVYQLPPAQSTTVGHTASVPPVSSCEEIPNNSPVGNACRGHHRMSVVHGFSTPFDQPPTDTSVPSSLPPAALSTSSPSPPLRHIWQRHARHAASR